MTTETGIWDTGGSQLGFFRICTVDAVAVLASQSSGFVNASTPIHPVSIIMAGEAGLRFFFCIQAGKGSNFGWISTRIHMFFPRAMTCLAGFFGTKFKALFSVDRIIEGFDLFFMASNAILAPYTLTGLDSS